MPYRVFVVSACLGLFSFFAHTQDALAWCQSCTVTRIQGPEMAGECTSTPECESGFTCIAGRCTRLCGPQPCVCLVDEDERLISWDRSCISYSLHREGSVDLPRETLERVVADSFAEWSEVSCGGTSIGFDFRQTSTDADGSTAEFSPDTGNVNLVSFVRNWDERDYLPSAYAVTTTWFGVRTGRIFDADILLNEEYWEWEDCAAGGCSGSQTIDVKNTLVHEIGHFLGIAHSGVGTETSTMWSCAPPGEITKRDLAADDIEGLCSIYPTGTFDGSCTGDIRSETGLPSDFDPVGGFNPEPIALRPTCGCSVSRGEPEFSFSFVAIGALVLMRRRLRSGG